MSAWLAQHPLWTYIGIFALIAYVYEAVFRIGKLPRLQHVAVYVLIGLGSSVLLIFQLFGLPIVLCLVVAIALMWTVRTRTFLEKRRSPPVKPDATEQKEEI